MIVYSVKNSNNSKAKLKILFTVVSVDFYTKSAEQQVIKLAWREVHRLCDVLVHDCTALYNK